MGSNPCSSFGLFISSYHFSLFFKASLSGRVRDAGAKAVLAKQLQGLGANLPDFVDEQTGQIRSKKPKKTKSPEEEALAEMRKMEKKPLAYKY